MALAPRPAGIVFLAAGWALENVARGLYAVFAAAVRQAAVPLAEQTRLAGVTMTIAMTTFPLGTALGGLLAALVGARGALVAGAAVAFLPGVPIARSRVLALRSIEDVEAS